MAIRDINRIFKGRITAEIFDRLTFVPAFNGGETKFEGIRRKPGALVVKYKTAIGHSRLRIGVAEYCMYLGAHSSLKTLQENGAREIFFSFNPTSRRSEMLNLKQKLWLSYLTKPLEDSVNFQLLNSLLHEKTRDKFEKHLAFRPAFYFDDRGVLRSSFQDYIQRTGWYVIKVNNVIDRVGQATGRLPRRALTYFTQSNQREKVHYDPHCGDVFETALIEFPILKARSLPALTQILNDFELRLIRVLKPKNNYVGSVITNEETGAWKSVVPADFSF